MYLAVTIKALWKLSNEKNELVYLYLLTFYFRFPPLSKQGTSDSSEGLEIFQQFFWYIYNG